MEYRAAVENKVEVPCPDTEQSPRWIALEEAGAGRCVGLRVYTGSQGSEEVGGCGASGMGLVPGGCSLETL